MSILPNDNLSSQIGPEKAKKSKIRRFLFKSYKPQPSIKTAIIVLALLGVVFIVIGAVLVYYGIQIREYKEKVDRDSDKNEKEENVTVTVTVRVDKEMKEPVYVYYQINKYFQNRRKYMQSISYKQLKGDEISREEADKQCHHADTKEMLLKRYEESGWRPDGKYKQKKKSDDDNPLDEVAYPCGLIAKSYPNISITLNDSKIDTDTKINEENIAWDYEKENRFKNITTKDSWTYVENGKI